MGFNHKTFTQYWPTTYSVSIYSQEVEHSTCNSRQDHEAKTWRQNFLLGQTRFWGINSGILRRLGEKRTFVSLCLYPLSKRLFDIIIKTVIWITDISETVFYIQEEGLWDYLFTPFTRPVFYNYACELILTLTESTIAVKP